MKSFIIADRNTFERVADSFAPHVVWASDAVLKASLRRLLENARGGVLVVAHREEPGFFITNTIHSIICYSSTQKQLKSIF